MVLMCWEKILLMLQVLAYFWRIFPELRIGFFHFLTTLSASLDISVPYLITLSPNIGQYPHGS